MPESADARKATQQCQTDQIRMLAMLEEALRVERLVQQHDIDIKEFREDHLKLKASVEALKMPLESLVKKINTIEETTTAISPLLKQYGQVRTWATRIAYSISICTLIYIFFGSNAVKLIALILTAMAK